MHEITLPNAKKNDLAFAAQSIPILGHGNQLKNVTDNAYIEGFKDGNNGNTLSQDYEYDINGNMTTDRNKGITSIAYNPINLPTRVVFENLDPQYSTTWKAITYTYDATGVKLQKTVQQGSIGSHSTTHTKYATHYIYVEDATGETLTFFSHPEGYVEPNTGNGYDYVYQYKDHLGNIRLSYKNTGTGSSPNLEILEENNYYPFGLKHKGYNGNVSANSNSAASKFMFGGKEYQQELGLDWYDITARNYDPALGRWMNIDPLAEKMRRHSPYNYAFDNPIKFIDPDGMAPIWIRNVGDDGTITYTAEKGDSAYSLHQQYGEQDSFTAEQANDMVEGQLRPNYVRESDGMLMSNVEVDDVVGLNNSEPPQDVFSQTSTQQDSYEVLDMDGDGSLDSFTFEDTVVTPNILGSDGTKTDSNDTTNSITQKAVEMVGNRGMRYIFGPGGGSLLSSQPLNGGENELNRRSRLINQGINPDATDREIDSILLTRKRDDYIKKHSQN